MTSDPQGKVHTRHLKRQAYLYVRQSSLRQVLENTESTERQYALKQRALALGWKADQVVVIDSDLGQSGASSAARACATRSGPTAGNDSPRRASAQLGACCFAAASTIACSV